MKAGEWINSIRNREQDRNFGKLYGADSVTQQAARYTTLLSRMNQYYPGDDVMLFSTPGRTEISGNHTDHNLGKVIAAGVHLDSIGAVARSNEMSITLISDQYNSPFVVDLSMLDAQEKEIGTTCSLIRGIAARLKQLNYTIGGMHGFITSNVLTGSGLSSSASIEVLIATMFNHLYNKGRIQPLDLAMTCQYAENRFFGKPCGLMDQTACAFGGITAIDFKNPQNIAIEKLSYNFQKNGFTLVVVHSGGSHADLTHAYAQIPAEMKSVARELGKAYCREVALEEFVKKLPVIREKVGDRALLRYLHFYNENIRVNKQIEYLKTGDIKGYFEEVRQSGSSSWQLLQNCYEPGDPFNQGISLALALTEEFLQKEGACRVHGGGFAGTIQAYIPNSRLNAYIQYLEPVFGKGAVIPLMIREEGTYSLMPQ